MAKIWAFNWKMNPQSFGEAKRLLTYNLQPTTNNKNVEVIICPPFVYLEKLIASAFAKGYGGLRFASQDVFWENKGAYTGEISPIMLKNLGVEYVIIGHSERRKHLAETDEMINKKVLAALKAGLKVILCVGEENRELGIMNKKLVIRKAKSYVKKQLEKDLPPQILKKNLGGLIVAYEPVWAIGTGLADTSEDAAEMIKYIKEFLISNFQFSNPKVLYGGSVGSKNIKDFVQYNEINGFLVGSASLKPLEIGKIIMAINHDK